MNTAHLLDLDTSSTSSNVVPLNRPHPLAERLMSQPELITQFLEEDEDASLISDVPEHYVLCAGYEHHELVPVDEFCTAFAALHALEGQYHAVDLTDVERVVLDFPAKLDRDQATEAARHPTVLRVYTLLRALQRYHSTSSHRAGKSAVLSDLIRTRSAH